MKFLLKIVGVLLLVFSLSSCVVHDNNGRRSMPPGHAKKMYGGSARQYSPGHVKKNKYYKKDNRNHGHKKHKGNHRGRH